MKSLVDKIALLDAAKDALRYSYSPYSSVRVGAALLTKGGKIYTGANVENASYTPTVCAERVAFFKAISDGEREFSAIAIAGKVGEDNEGGVPFYPCGVCRQVMSEFCDGDFIILVSLEDTHEEFTLAELLPKSFKI